MTIVAQSSGLISGVWSCLLPSVDACIMWCPLSPCVLYRFGNLLCPLVKNYELCYLQSVLAGMLYTSTYEVVNSRLVHQMQCINALLVDLHCRLAVHLPHVSSSAQASGHHCDSAAYFFRSPSLPLLYSKFIFCLFYFHISLDRSTSSLLLRLTVTSVTSN